jgi:hypothetical protein
MTKAERIELMLRQKGVAIDRVGPIAHGIQIKSRGGIVINVYNTGKVLVQGRDQDYARRLVAEVENTTHPTATIETATGKRQVASGGDEGDVPDNASDPGNYCRTTPESMRAVLESFPADPEFITRRPADWSSEPWDGQAVPF